MKFITSLNQGLKCRGYKLETYYALTFSCSSYNYAHIAEYCKNTGLNVIFGEEITPDFQDREAWADILHFERNEFCEIRNFISNKFEELTKTAVAKAAPVVKTEIAKTVSKSKDELTNYILEPLQL